MKELIDFLRKEEDLELSEKTTKEKFLSYGMPGGPAKRLADFAKECKDKKSKAFSSYRSLKEVLKKFDIDGNGIGTIRQFPPVTYKLEDEEEELQQCIKEIKRKLGLCSQIVTKPCVVNTFQPFSMLRSISSKE
ncbi:hypothetical protein RhiirC2_803698 [Rhizophagus irregularis]|uniref:Uncharacterized protein n=1 Tax=Rhizophagus irregularis TaxID=588596 RepID=A0A2N1LCW8_9GLOM|nr:hypothetical protein RhiirC2_803698 [Rhizophagus irregularis]